jgi:hypothetical protein
MRAFWLFGFAGLLSLAAGCASGPRFDTVEKSFAPVPPGKGRIFVYRATSLGAAITPDVMMNGAVVGKSEGNGIFYVDRDPGNIEVVTTSEVERKLTFTIAAGETRYVRCAVGLGVLTYRIIPELVSEEEAKKEIHDLAYTGGK